jgi:hypothetical protein
LGDRLPSIGRKQRCYFPQGSWQVFPSLLRAPVTGCFVRTALLVSFQDQGWATTPKPKGCVLRSLEEADLLLFVVLLPFGHFIEFIPLDLEDALELSIAQV